MKRKISEDEVRRFFDTVNKEFMEAGFILHTVTFVRNPLETHTEVKMQYSERRPHYVGKI